MASSLLAWYNGQQVRLGVPTNSLVFDGVNFVPPSDAKTVALVPPRSVGPASVPALWPETQTVNQVAMSWSNTWLCQVISANGPDISSIDVSWIVDPNNGACVCGVTCPGTELQYVVVTPNLVIIRPPEPEIPVFQWPSPVPVPEPTPVTIVNLPTDPPPPGPGDVVLELMSGQFIRAQPLLSIGGVDLGLLITSVT